MAHRRPFVLLHAIGVLIALTAGAMGLKRRRRA